MTNVAPTPRWAAAGSIRRTGVDLISPPGQKARLPFVARQSEVFDGR